jgi:hypothetical protein
MQSFVRLVGHQLSQRLDRVFFGRESAAWPVVCARRHTEAVQQEETPARREVRAPLLLPSNRIHRAT